MPITRPEEFALAGGDRTSRQRDAPITRLHLHNGLELGFCHEGSGIFVIEDKVFPYQAGDVSVINDREWHLAQSVRGTESLWTWIHVDPARLIEASGAERDLLRTAPLGGPGFPNLLPARAYPEVNQEVRAVIRELQGRALGYRAAVRGHVRTLLVLLHRISGANACAAVPSRQEALERVAPALEHIARGFAGPVSVADLAGRCHASVTNLRRLFHAAVGKSPQQYLIQVRMQMATALLESTTKPILEIALDVGYPTLSSFNRHFKRILGMAPRAWRRRG